MNDPFLTSPRANVMLGYCPQYYESSRVFKSYLQAIGLDLDNLKQGIEEILDQFFVQTATWGLDKWEEELGLISYAGKPDDQRRSRIMSKLRGIGTVTITLIKNVAEAYDSGTVDVTQQPELYQITITFIDTIGIPPNINDLMDAIEEIKPAHLNVVYKYRYNTHAVVGNHTHTQLAAYTHEQIRASVLS